MGDLHDYGYGSTEVGRNVTEMINNGELSEHGKSVDVNNNDGQAELDENCNK